MKWGEKNERQMANDVNCEEMRFVIRNLVDVEDPPRQRRQKFLLMSARTTSVFPQRGRDDAVVTVGISLSDEIKVIETLGEPPHTM